MEGAKAKQTDNFHSTSHRGEKPTSIGNKWIMIRGICGDNLRRLECLGELVLEFTAWIDGEDAHDGNSDGAVGPNILSKDKNSCQVIETI
jgi:hypothetical protein